MGFFNSSEWNKPISKGNRLPKCGECGLSKQCYSPRMEPTGDGDKSILFVAEAPGEKEDNEGIQLIGKAGQLLRECLYDMDEDLDEAFKTNCVICRPPGNEMKDVYINSCRPNLLKTIEKLKPKVIILLGKSAVSSLITTEWQKELGELSRWVGWTIPSQKYNAWICPTYHPSYINRLSKDVALKTMFKQHLKRAYELESAPLTTLNLEKLKRDVEIIKNPREARLRLKDLSKKKGILAFDYETTGLKPEREGHQIVSCSFCLDGENTFAIKIDDRSKILLSKVLKNPKLKKVASNMKFEERWTRFMLGYPVANWWHDTMLCAHILDNRTGVSSVKFLSYIYFGIADYDSHIEPYLKAKYTNDINRIHRIPIDDLLMYNGLDSLLEFKVMEIQKELLEV